MTYCSNVFIADFEQENSGCAVSPFKLISLGVIPSESSLISPHRQEYPKLHYNTTKRWVFRILPNIYGRIFRVNGEGP